jgi:hypothetical protein
MVCGNWLFLGFLCTLLAVLRHQALILMRRAILDDYQRPSAVDSISEMFTRKKICGRFLQRLRKVFEILPFKAQETVFMA